jgi:hypothetical protein
MALYITQGKETIKTITTYVKEISKMLKINISLMKTQLKEKIKQLIAVHVIVFLLLITRSP